MDIILGDLYMKMNDKCLPCLVNQVVKVANMTHAKDREGLYSKVFRYLSEIDFKETNPEIIGETFKILKEHIGNNDPYKEIRRFYNHLFLEKADSIRKRIEIEADAFETAIKYAIIGNIIDFNPSHTITEQDMMKWFEKANDLTLTINHMNHLKENIKTSKIMLYLGDNCGEICLDKLLLQQIKCINPELNIYFGVRGTPVVNDSIEEDAYLVGINEYAQIISNGDSSLGTVLHRTSKAFQDVYNSADIIISKGQANYESLSEEKGKNIYYLLMTKCQVIANDIGVKQNALICLNSN